MKIPKKIKRFCPYCKKQTEQKVIEISTGIKRGAMAWGGTSRARKRGRGRGHGNRGRWGSKKAIGKWKRKKKTTKKTNLLYQCSECKKKKYQKQGKRTGKLQIE